MLISQQGFAQADSGRMGIVKQADSGAVVVVKDPRIDQLVRKQIAINEETTRESRRNVPGFRIQVINSPDRSKVFVAKGKIYQEFPDMKPYLMYQAPNYKLKVGNFKTQEEAITWAKKEGHSPNVARVRHQNEKNIPDHWRPV